MNQIAAALDKFLNRDVRCKMGFVLLVFECGEKEGRADCISNGVDRKGIVTLLKEQIKRFEGQPDVTGRG